MTVSDADDTTPGPGTKPLTRHPPGLYYLFFTEMWERFSFYGMRALLVLYMIKHLKYEQAFSSHIYGLYIGFVYLTPFFGGLIADRLIGQRRSVIIGGAVMALGHFMMAFECLFFPALICLVIGNGFFKPNISTQVGALYPKGDPLRDRAFSIFYFGINLGAFLSPLVCGYLRDTQGWHWGFAAAGFGMLFGLVVYIYGQRHLAPDLLSRQKQAPPMARPALTATERKRLWAFGVLCLISIFFWAVYEQQGNTMGLWFDSFTDRAAYTTIEDDGTRKPVLIPTEWYQSANPLIVMLLTPLVAGLWSIQSRRGREHTNVAKMGLGFLFLGAGQLVMIPAAQTYAASGQPVHYLWITIATLILTIGELYLSPVGLSMVTKIAPPHMVSMMMGIWFLSSFIGNNLSGMIGAYWEVMSKEGFFLLLAGLAFGAGLCVFALLRPLQKAIGSDA
jgi:proton-dependent oligopeptide transporter, POT family